MAKKTVTPETPATSQEKSVEVRMKIIDNICAEYTARGSILAGRVTNNAAIRKRMTFRYYPTEIPELNSALGGGLPIGRIVLIPGLDNTGKTGFCWSFIGYNMQRDPNFSAVWVESEESIDTNKVESLYHVDMARCPIIGPDRKHKKEFGAEAVGNALEAILKQAPPNCIVINSLKMLVPMMEMNCGLEKDTVAAQARFNSKFMKRIVSLCAENDTTLIIIQHYTTAVGEMYGNPLKIAGGIALKHANMVTLEFSKLKIDDGDPVTYETGMKFQIRITRNHCMIDRFPYAKIVYYIEFGKGIERVFTTLNRLVDYGYIVKAGAWYYRLGENGEKDKNWSWNGKLKFKEDMDAHPERFEELKALLDVNAGVEQMSNEEVKEIEEEEKKIAEAIAKISGTEETVS